MSEDATGPARCYVCTIGDFEGQRDILRECLESRVYKLHRDARWPSPLERITQGDTLLLKFQNRVVAWGISRGSVGIKPDGFDDGWNRIVNVDRWRSKNPSDPLDGVHHYGIQAATKPGAGQFAVVKEVESDWAGHILSQFGQQTGIRTGDAEEPDKVTCGQLSLANLFDQPLAIPDYQRCFCWRKRNVLALLQSLRGVVISHNAGEVHLGTVILKQGDNRLDIVDGQQRLLTLTLLLHASGHRNLPLLRSSLAGQGTDASSARKHLLWAYTTVKEWLAALALPAVPFAHRVQFCVVVLPRLASEDLAYSFFNSVNSAGKRLSDYDLLKAHHLRFVPDEATAANMAERWDTTDAEELDRVLHRTLYRLRLWSRHGDPAVDAQDGHHLFSHFSARASTVKGLFYPPLGLSYNSAIRGGASFFHYTELHRHFVNELMQTNAASELAATLGGHNRNVLMDCIRTLLFLFFCRFGRTYLDDGLFCIASVVSSLRNEGRVRATAITNPVFKECVWAIDTATDPGQFFDWCLAPERGYAPRLEPGVKQRYWEALARLFSGLQKRLILSEQCGRRLKLLTSNAPAQETQR